MVRPDQRLPEPPPSELLPRVSADVDNLSRLVYADWLEEHGDARADYLRLEMELAALPENDQRLAELEQRGADLRAALGDIAS